MSDRPESAKLRTGRLSRLLKLGSVATGFVKDAAGASVSSGGRLSDLFHERAARRLEEALGDMKGLPMKLGQMLSYVDDLVPEAQRHLYRNTLRKLQADTTPHPWEAMRQVIVDDLGHPPEELFAEFDTSAASAASIGQVYRAVTKDGQKVAVKVQYPGVRQALESDTKNLDALVSAFSFALPRVDIESTLKEITGRLLDECDYELELRNQEKFGKIWRDDPVLFVPRPLAELSGQRVLVSEWVEGQSWQVLLENSDAQSRSKVGQALFRFVFTSLNRHGLFNADPHPGNFLFTAEGRVACLDFGCVHEFPQPFMRLLVQTRDAILEDQRGPEVHTLIEEAYGIGERFNAPMWAAVDEYLYTCLEPIHAPQPFRFNRSYTKRLFDQTKHMKLTLLKHGLRQGLSASNRPGIVFLGRIQMGLYSLLSELEAEGDWAELLLTAESN